MSSKTWFITGTSRGFGREWTMPPSSGATRSPPPPATPAPWTTWSRQYGDRLLPITLDVTDRAADFAAVAQAHEHFGRLDVVVNNAGYGQFGMVEELSEAESREQIETNLFGALWVTQAALPFLREQGSGHIIQVSSIGGISAFPTVGIYHASKWALEGITQSLAQEVAGFGIKVTLIEPGGYSTDWGGASAGTPRRSTYDGVREQAAERPSRGARPATRSPPATAILQVVDAEEPPLRIFFGEAPLAIATADYESRLTTWNEWQPVSIARTGRQA